MPVKSAVLSMIRFTATRFTRMRQRTLPKRMLERYRAGQFPMTSRFGLIRWHSPEKRAIIPLDDRFKIGRRLERRISSNVFRVTFDTAFSEVVAACAEVTARRGETWISPELIKAYTSLHELGYAHCVEVWNDGRLVGGEFGVALRGLYCGESAFTREDYASRVAMVYLVGRLRERGFKLLDSQNMSSLAREFGAYEATREQYQELLAEALEHDPEFS